MRTRRLGRTELELPVVTFGAWAIGGWHWGGTDDALAIAAIREGLQHGVTAIDTAPVYGFGHSERIVGRALEGRGGEALVLTRVGLLVAWTVAQLGVTSAIVGARRPEQARENAGAGALTLTPLELARIRAAFEVLELRLPQRHAPLTRLRRLAARVLGRG